MDQVNGANAANPVEELLRAFANQRPIVKLAEFNYADPELWLAQVEDCLLTSRVTAEREKFTHVSKLLDPRVAGKVRDIIVNVPPENPYTVLESDIIKRLCSSQEEKTRRLLEVEDIGDRKLPASMQPVLAIQKDTDLDKVSEMANHVYDLTRNRPIVAETSSATESLVKKFSQMMSAMQQKITTLRSEVSVATIEGLTRELNPIATQYDIFTISRRNYRVRLFFRLSILSKHSIKYLLQKMIFAKQPL